MTRQQRRETRIRTRAYFLWQQAGFPQGRDYEFWTQAAEKEQGWASRLKVWLTSQKDALSALQALATILALIAGGYWTWLLFDPMAQMNPNLYVTHRIETRELGNDLLFVHLTLLMENTSKRTAYLTCGDIWVYQVDPSPKKVIEQLTNQRGIRDAEPLDLPVLKWSFLDLSKAQYIVEAGNKSERSIDFILPESSDHDSNTKVRTIKIFSDIQRAVGGDRSCRYRKDGGIDGPGWITESLYSLPERPTGNAVSLLSEKGKSQ